MSISSAEYHDGVPVECHQCGCDSYSDTAFLDERPYFGRDFDCGNTFWVQWLQWSDTCKTPKPEDEEVDIDA